MSTAMNADRWLSVQEIAAYLGVKSETIYTWIENKDMPAHRVGAALEVQDQRGGCVGAVGQGRPEDI